jgi:hypothetical protein
MPLEPIIEHGRKRSVDLVDEEGLMVDKVSLRPMRDETTRKGADRTTIYARYDDPRIEGEIGGRPFMNAQGNPFGLGNIHPGVAVDLANLADGQNVHGFDIEDDNTTIVLNPTRELDDGADGCKVTVPFVHRPFIPRALAA